MGVFDSVTVRGSVAAAHGRELPSEFGRQVWFFEPEDDAVVLGSTQPIATLDLGEVHRRGLGVVRRRSGGGAVLVEAGALSWFDVLLPAADELSVRDVSSSAYWLGAVVSEALRSLDFDASAPVRVPDRSPWSSLVCFAGVGAGEVRVAGRKAVGISQRRTRAGARFQVTLLHRFDADATVALFALGDHERGELAAHLRATVGAVDVAPARLRVAVSQALATR